MTNNMNQNRPRGVWAWIAFDLPHPDLPGNLMHPSLDLTNHVNGLFLADSQFGAYPPIDMQQLPLDMNSALSNNMALPAMEAPPQDLLADSTRSLTSGETQDTVSTLSQQFDPLGLPTDGVIDSLTINGLDQSLETAALFEDALYSCLLTETDLRLAHSASSTPSNLSASSYTGPAESTAVESPPARPLSPCTSLLQLESPPRLPCSESSCPATFTSVSLRSKHERKHTRPFVCVVCEKGHTYKKDLHRHMWVKHTRDAERNDVPCPVRKCPVEGCHFEGRQDNVARHARTIHSAGPKKRPKGRCS